MTELVGARGEAREASALSVLDRMLYALFSRHADDDRHAGDRRRYRGTDLRTSFDVYLARVYGLSWVACLGAAAVVGVAGVAVAGRLPPGVGSSLRVPAGVVGVTAGLVAGLTAKTATVRLGGVHLRWRAGARRSEIERTLPGAVRYLHVLSSGSDGPRAMLRKVAATDAYGATAVSLRKVLNTAALTGSVDEGLDRVARDTPSRDLLAPFLLKFREHAGQGEVELANYLGMESRMLGHRQSRARQRAEGFLELFAEIFMVLLVLPALLVIVLTVMSAISPALALPVATPLGETTVRGVVVHASAAFVLVTGVSAAIIVAGLRPPGQSVRYERPAGVWPLLRSAATNPASAAVVGLGPAAGVAWLLKNVGHPVDAVLLGYAAYAIPVGAVAVRRGRIDDEKDRELEDFVHAVSGHVNLGRPFPEAVELVAGEIDFGALHPDVVDLAANLGFTARGSHADERDVRTAALDRFVARVGTPLAEQTVGLVTGALDGGSDPGTVFDTLQTEVGRLYHEKRELRSNMLVYVAVGWTTALLVVGITVAVGTYVFEGFAQLSALSRSTGHVLSVAALDVQRARLRLYLVTQTTMLASGWFAGSALRGRYDALLHSGALVVVCHVVYVGAGMI